jgi:hypothetical protein
MKKFNLEEALAGKPVVTIDGREVSQLTLFYDVPFHRKLVGVVDGDFCYWTESGSCWLGGKLYVDDLRMDPKKIKRWVNVYPAETGYIVSGSVHSDEKEAAKANRGGITAKIEWEE